VGDAAAELAHDLFTPGEHRDGIAVGDRLGKSAQVRVDAVELLNAAARNAKTGLDLIDQQYHAVLVAQLARGAQVFGFGRNAETISHDGLNQKTGDRAALALEDVLELVGVVGLHEVREAARADGYALAVGLHIRIPDLR